MAKSDTAERPLVFALAQPIQAHDEQIKELKLREPTSLDLIEVGSPVRIDVADPSKIAHDERKMAQMIARLGDIPPSSVQTLAISDFTKISWVLTPFFARGLFEI